MIIDGLIGLLTSLLNGLAILLPAVPIDSAIDSAGYVGELGRHDWLFTIVHWLRGVQDGWGVPIATMLQILSLWITIQIAWATITAVTWTFNKIRGSG